MMKVALLFYGQPRFIDNLEVYDSYKTNILDRYDTDVFCHTWWSKENSEYEYSTWSKISKCPILPNALDIIKERYEPRVLLSEEPKTFEFSNKVKEFVEANFLKSSPEGVHWNAKNYSNVLSQLYSIKEVSQVFDCFFTSKIYDWVILARYDTVLINFPDLHKCDNTKFYLPDHHPRFPDTIQFFGPRYIEWSKNIFNDVDDVYQNIWQPSPEAFKMCSFLKRFTIEDLAPYPMDAHCIRE